MKIWPFDPFAVANGGNFIHASELDQALLPFVVGEPFNKPAYAVTYFVVNSLDQRVEFDKEIAGIEASDDPYRLRRETYLAQRRRDIAELKGEPISERDRMWLEELEELKAAQSPAPPQPASTATYCSPSTAYVIGAATIPVCAGNDHSLAPFFAS